MMVEMILPGVALGGTLTPVRQTLFDTSIEFRQRSETDGKIWREHGKIGDFRMYLLRRNVG